MASYLFLLLPLPSAFMGPETICELGVPAGSQQISQPFSGEGEVRAA